MNLAKNLIGGILIMIVATVIGVVHNAVRSEPIKLFPRAAGAPVTSEATTTLPPGTPRITDAEFAAGEIPMNRVNTLVASGAVVLIDARSEGEYAEGHLPGAMNVPYDSFVDYAGELESNVLLDQPVIIYCRSVTCDLSDQLAQEMRLMGYERVVLYKGGWDEWTAAGLPTEGGE